MKINSKGYCPHCKKLVATSQNRIDWTSHIILFVLTLGLWLTVLLFVVAIHATRVSNTQCLECGIDL